MAMTLNPNLLLAVPLAPLAGSLITGLCSKTISRYNAHRVTIFGIAIAFIISVRVLLQVMDCASFNGTIYEWAILPGIASGQATLKLEIGFLVDSLSAMMMCVVTFVSLMVHIYTIGYMAEDPSYQRFFSYISLFTFSMLMLVMSNNLLQLFFGWEAVGLVSYLLIGFWYSRPTAVHANLKAFLVNRIGDFGFLLGIGLVFSYVGSLNYGDIFLHREMLTSAGVLWGTQWQLITVTCICLFIGAMGKSAQFPLHVWLPDSMEGPTPISALIHAATMVTAGIFMVTRMSPLFELSDTALSFVIVIGSITTLFMGFLGIVQNDIKRVIAYSTLSQLGYMTVALGASAYSAAVFHLMTHAFFKALLFLGAGSVIIGMHHNQDIRDMGGLRKYMPITWCTSLIGILSLIGTPFFSGFYSKDSIIEAVKLSHLPGSGFAYFAVSVSVFVTALYSFRMFFMVFYGHERFRGLHHQPRYNYNHSVHEPFEPSWRITLPLVVLSIPSVVIGAIAVGPMISGDFFSHGVVLDKVIYVSEYHGAIRKMTMEFRGWIPMAFRSILDLPVWLALAGSISAWFLYLKQPNIPAVICQRFSIIYTLLDNKYYIDKINDIVFTKGVVTFSKKLWRGCDVIVIDGLVNGSARAVTRFASVIRLLQTGYIYHYAFAMVIGMLGLLALFVTLRR
ncbi:NADH-quinone oxidoreductase subunit L [Candidatus Vallotiella sp. (ex Adelges kitamiensis)]|uniref:NADH-quinone oxidoreductase subunit L n=1 Tax=Candidatus Vallotiella sp. (ex Adelges kitamiensis) TaxID=2864217 RepID=UPI001CE2DB21|nr:NADH-quinone oxidoreductase subunit L [Candidatus Vallotia sp. (ex Adelges kitamiensis)]